MIFMIGKAEPNNPRATAVSELGRVAQCDITYAIKIKIALYLKYLSASHIRR